MIHITSRTYWFKVVDFLQHSWALIEPIAGVSSVRIYFINDASGVYDELVFDSKVATVDGLERNGFSLFKSDATWQHLRKPKAPFRRRNHPGGPPYSSGRYWSE